MDAKDAAEIPIGMRRVCPALANPRSPADCRSGAPQSAASWEHDHEKTQSRPGPGRPDLQRGHCGRPSGRTGHELVYLILMC